MRVFHELLFIDFSCHKRLASEHQSGTGVAPCKAAARGEKTTMNHPYLLITPTRDEIAHARKALDSVIAQSVPPTQWIIVDDGSTDGTESLLDQYAQQYSFIHVIHRPNRGRRSVGPGVIDAFYAGLDQANLDDFEFLCKLDLDLQLPPRYFQRLLEHMRDQPRLGAVSGKPFFRDATGDLRPEVASDEMSVGMTKFYRTACFTQIGGFVRQVMWDGIDCHRCRMFGWLARSIDEPALRFIHLRPMGSSQQSILTGRFRHGFGQYFMGTSLTYLTASVLFRIKHPPAVIGSLATWLGYMHSLITFKPRYADRDFRRFLRRYQRQCLLLGKARATAQLNDRQAQYWHPQYTVDNPSLSASPTGFPTSSPAKPRSLAGVRGKG